MQRRRRLKYICIVVAVGIAAIATIGLNDRRPQEEKLLHKAIMMAAFSEERNAVFIKFSDGEPSIVVIPRESRRARRHGYMTTASSKPGIIHRIRISKPAMSAKLKSELSQRTTRPIESAIAALEQGYEVRVWSFRAPYEVFISLDVVLPPGTMVILGGSDMIVFAGKEFRAVGGR
ncbi:MAG: hypothetical protein IH944_07940 [Armatimonadetes bacterium]|nr:hypothetical protein [Armatimonadota bacterium]